MPSTKTTYSISFRDISNEIGTLSVYIPASPDPAALAAFEATVEAAALGVWAQDQTSTVTRWSNELPLSDWADREDKLLVTYQDAVTLAKYVFTIPTIDKTYFPRVIGSDLLDLFTGTAGTNSAIRFKNELEDLITSPVGNAITVLQMKLVGRNI